MRRTFTLPNGIKAISQSQRRYVWASVEGRILRRSDNLSTIYKAWNGSGYLVDTLTGETKYGR